jgi:glycerol-3-phosphate acyltransferase PlsY
MRHMLLAIAFPALGYLAGSLASAIIVCRVMGLPDPRSGGSGNPGATNVLRLGGKFPAALTLLGDVLKGVLPVLAAHAAEIPPPALALTAFGAFLGHLYPVFFRFQGGKGVATAFGAIIALSWPVGLAFGLVWITLAATTRYSSVASLGAAVLAPGWALALVGNPSYAAVLALVAALIIWRHRENIRRLRDGTEGRIGQKSGG